jgi:hypothetical protein
MFRQHRAAPRRWAAMPVATTEPLTAPGTGDALRRALSDAARLDAALRGRAVAPPAEPPFARFPRWMWRNAEMRDFTDCLGRHNAALPRARRVALRGLDIGCRHMFETLRSLLDRGGPDAPGRGPGAGQPCRQCRRDRDGLGRPVQPRRVLPRRLPRGGGADRLRHRLRHHRLRAPTGMARLS